MKAFLACGARPRPYYRNPGGTLPWPEARAASCRLRTAVYLHRGMGNAKVADQQRHGSEEDAHADLHEHGHRGRQEHPDRSLLTLPAPN